jgi:uncharacterized membrane protein
MGSSNLQSEHPGGCAFEESAPQPSAISNQNLTWISSFAPNAFLILALLFSLYYLFVTPPFQVPDERAHFNRALGISSFTCVANASTDIPKSVIDMEAAFPERLELAPPVQHWVTLSSFTPWLKRRTTAREVVPFENPAANLYSCIPYIPSAAVIGLARLAETPPLALLYLGRLVNLIAFAALTYCGLRALPDFHLFLLGLALMPMTLGQAASLSADAITIGTSFFFVAYVLKLAFDERVVQVTRARFFILAVAVASCSLTKFNVWLTLLVLLIPSSKFPSQSKRWAFVFTILLCACGSAFMWQILNSSNVQIFNQLKVAQGAGLDKNALFLRHHPDVVFSAFERTLHDFRFAYPTMFVGWLGYLTLPLPFPVVEFYLGTLLLIALTQTWRVQLHVWHRALLAIVFTASFLSIFALLFILETADTYLSTYVMHGMGYINGVQGRYFIPIALPLLLLFSTRKIHIPVRVAFVALLLMAGVANTVEATSIWNTFYHDGARNKFDHSAIRTQDGLVYFESNGVFRRVVDPDTLRILGVKDQIHPATSRDLHSLPLGPPFPSLPGKVIQQASTGAVFLIQNGQKCHIPDPETLDAMNVASQIHGVPDSVADAVPTGPPLPHLSRADAASKARHN